MQILQGFQFRNIAIDLIPLYLIYKPTRFSITYTASNNGSEPLELNHKNLTLSKLGKFSHYSYTGQHGAYGIDFILIDRVSHSLVSAKIHLSPHLLEYSSRVTDQIV